MKNKNLLILAGVAFSAYAVYEIVYLILRLFVWHGNFFEIIFEIIDVIICLGGCVLCAFSLFKFNPKLLILGLFGILGVASRIAGVIYLIADSIANHFHIEGGVAFYILKNLIIICGIVALGLYCFSQLNSSSSDQSVRRSDPEGEVHPSLAPQDFTAKLERLEKLQKLKDIDAITAEEFEATKQQILGS